MLTFLVALHDDPDTDNDYLILHKFLCPLTMLKTRQGNEMVIITRKVRKLIRSYEVCGIQKPEQSRPRYANHEARKRRSVSGGFLCVSGYDGSCSVIRLSSCGRSGIVR